MRRRLDFDLPATVLVLEENTDLGGGAVEREYVERATIWIQVEPTSGRQTNRYDASTASVATHRVTTRFPFEDGAGRRLTLDTSLRIAFTKSGRARTLDVLSILDDYEREETVTLLCQEVQG